MKYFWNYYIPLRAGPVNQESHRYFIYRYLTDIFVKSYAYLTDISSSCIDLIFVFQFNFVVNIRVHSSYHHQIAFTEFELQNLNYKYANLYPTSVKFGIVKTLMLMLLGEQSTNLDLKEP